MPTITDTYLPHREQMPYRFCSHCGCLLSTGNHTDLCWPCGHAWEPVLTARIPASHREALDMLVSS